MKSRAQRYRYVRHVVSGTRPSPWSPLSLGSSLAAWYKADAGCYTDAACLFASASSQYLSRTSSAGLLVGSGDFTYVAFANMTSLAANYALFGKGNPDVAAGEIESFVSITTGTVSLRIRDAGGTRRQVDSTDALSAGSFGMVELSSSGTTLSVRINNGTAATGTTGGGMQSGTSDLAIGSSANTSMINGAVGRVGIWSRALTSAERVWLYNAGAGRFYAELGVAGTDGSDLKTSLVEYWNLCEASGTRVGSHAGLNLTPTNGPTVAAGPGEGAAVNNSPVKRWESQYGSKHVTQSDIAKQPLWIAAAQNGRAVLRGNGTSTYLTRNGALFSAQPLTIGAVVKYSTADAFEYVIDGDTADRVILGKRGGGSNAAQLYADNLLTGGLANAGGYKSQIGVVNGASSILRYGNAEVATGDAGAAKLGTDYNLMAGNGGSAWLNGDLCEVVCASVAASAGVLTSMESYFRSGWGL